LFWALISPSCSFHEVRSVHTRGQRETVRQAKKTAICIRSEWNAAPSLFETLKHLETHRCETALRLYYQPETFLCERRRLHRRISAQSEKEEDAGFKAEMLHRRTSTQSEKKEGAGFKAEAPACASLTRSNSTESAWLNFAAAFFYLLRRFCVVLISLHLSAFSRSKRARSALRAASLSPKLGAALASMAAAKRGESAY